MSKEKSKEKLLKSLHALNRTDEESFAESLSKVLSGAGLYDVDNDDTEFKEIENKRKIVLPKDVSKVLKDFVNVKYKKVKVKKFKKKEKILDFEFNIIDENQVVEKFSQEQEKAIKFFSELLVKITAYKSGLAETIEEYQGYDAFKDIVYNPNLLDDIITVYSIDQLVKEFNLSKEDMMKFFLLKEEYKLRNRRR